jgi:hypothetical protein
MQWERTPCGKYYGLSVPKSPKRTSRSMEYREGSAGLSLTLSPSHKA